VGQWDRLEVASQWLRLLLLCPTLRYHDLLDLLELFECLLDLLNSLGVLPFRLLLLSCLTSVWLLLWWLVPLLLQPSLHPSSALWVSGVALW
jgi:hypothetical protein